MAVFTKVSDAELGDFLGRYDVGEAVSLKGIADGVQNTNFLLATTQGPFILTLFEDNVAKQELPFFFGLMEHLSVKDISCPVPVVDRAGQVINALAGRPAALVTFLNGLSINQPKVIHCAAVGRTLGQLHLATSDFKLSRNDPIGPRNWQKVYQSLGGRADDILAGLDDELRAELAFMERAWPAKPRVGAGNQVWPAGIETGIIHADLFPDNVFFQGDELTGLIDFYVACSNAFAYDIAVCLNAWCFDQMRDFNLGKATALLVGYQEIRKLTAQEREVLPLLARGAALRFLLSRSLDWLNTSPDALVCRKDPAEYLRYLHFHQGVTSASEYGL